MPPHLSSDFLRKVRRAGRALNALARVSPALAGQVAFRIFCAPRRLPMHADDHAFLHTAIQSQLKVKRLVIRVYHWPATASARTVLVLHGWESHSARWQQHIHALIAEGFSVYAIDGPASGFSTGRMLNMILFSQVVQAFIAKNGTPYAIVGHSLGGAAAVMSLAVLQAERPKKLILLSAFDQPSRVIRDFGAIMGLEEIVLNQVDRELERRSGFSIADYAVAAKVATLTDVKGLVMHDIDDDFAPIAEGRQLADAWGATFMETRGLGHGMQGPDVVAAIIDFIKAP